MSLAGLNPSHRSQERSWFSGVKHVYGWVEVLQIDCFLIRGIYHTPSQAAQSIDVQQIFDLTYSRRQKKKNFDILKKRSDGKIKMRDTRFELITFRSHDNFERNLKDIAGI